VDDERLSGGRLPAARTVEDQVFQRLRAAILTGSLAPGSRLRLRQLAEVLDVSPSPVRGALQRLRAEGLVRYTPHSGSIVTPLEYEELEELQAFRVGIEGLAAELGARAVTDNDLGRMSRQLELVDTLSGEGDLRRYFDAEWRFREMCFRASGRDRLVGYVLDFRQRAERYLQVAFSTPGGLGQSVQFQRALYSACEDRDGDAAREITREALEWTLTVVKPHLPGTDQIDKGTKVRQ
jgi:DNA-binding GntR family transcriptional regulator